jgi:phosphoenolpyruvate-protein kinase (PTS system EI component)
MKLTKKELVNIYEVITQILPGIHKSNLVMRLVKIKKQFANDYEAFMEARKVVLNDPEIATKMVQFVNEKPISGYAAKSFRDGVYIYHLPEDKFAIEFPAIQKKYPEAREISRDVYDIKNQAEFNKQIDELYKEEVDIAVDKIPFAWIDEDEKDPAKRRVDITGDVLEILIPIIEE